MSEKRSIFIGTDSGATTSKVGAVWSDGTIVGTELLQRPTGTEHGPDAVVRGWVEAIDGYLAQHAMAWDQVRGVGLAVPGPYERYGVLGRASNLPRSFVGFDVYTAYSRALAASAGRDVPLVVGNDGNMGGVAEAKQVRGSGTGTVLLLAPGSGLGSAFIDARGLPLDGDTLAGMEAGHMALPLQELGLAAFPCGCGRTWGCAEMYTSLAGLPYLLAAELEKHPEHELNDASRTPKQRAFALRGLAQNGDPLAQRIFDLQAKAMGLHVANLAMALDPTHVVIGGGLMDPGSTSQAFRDRYITIVRETATPLLWDSQKNFINIVPAALGDLSQAIGAALVAWYRDEHETLGGDGHVHVVEPESDRRPS